MITDTYMWHMQQEELLKNMNEDASSVKEEDMRNKIAQKLSSIKSKIDTKEWIDYMIIKDNTANPILKLLYLVEKDHILPIK